MKTEYFAVVSTIERKESFYLVLSSKMIEIVGVDPWVEVPEVKTSAISAKELEVAREAFEKTIPSVVPPGELDRGLTNAIILTGRLALANILSVCSSFVKYGLEEQARFSSETFYSDDWIVGADSMLRLVEAVVEAVKEERIEGYD